MERGSHRRSVSLPSSSHPSTLKVEEELNKLKTLEITSSSSTSSSICNGLSGLEDLYTSVNDLLNVASTQEVLFNNKSEKCLEQLLEGSLRLLDVCVLARDALLRLKEQVQALQSSIRRRKGDSSIGDSVANYACTRRMIKKDARKWIISLKQMEAKLGQSIINQDDHHLSVIIRILKEVNAMNGSIFQSLLMFLSLPSAAKPKMKSWSLVSKLMKKSVMMICEENELESFNCALAEDSLSVEKIQSAKKKLEELENCIEEIEKRLECVFRHLIRTRASILNIFSQ